MRYGMNLLLWADTLSDEALPLLDEIKEIGFDAVELPVFEADVKKYAKWGKHLDGMGLGRTGVTVRGAEDNPMSPDPKMRRKGIEANKAAWSAAKRRAARRWSARTIRPWATSAAPGDEGRVALGRGRHARGGRARGKVPRDAGAGVPQPVRVLSVELAQKTARGSAATLTTRAAR